MASTPKKKRVRAPDPRKTHPGFQPGRSDKKGLAGLTRLQVAFIDEYMVDRNSRLAAIRAGYSDNVGTPALGSRLLNIPFVSKEIARRTAEAGKVVDITANDVLRELKNIALFDVRKLFDANTGKILTNAHDLDDDAARALVNFDVVVLNKDGDYIVKLNPGNKMKALELLGKHLKMFTDKVETSGSMTVNYTTDFGENDEPDGDDD